MNRSKTPLLPALRRLADESAREPGPHPSPEELSAYFAGDLSPREEERLRDHFSLCTDCATLALDAAAFPDLDSGEPQRRLGDEEVAAEWQRMEVRLSAERRGRREAPASPFWSLRFAYSLATVLLAACVGLAAWVTSLHGTRGSSPGPRTDLRIANLVETTRGGGAQPGGLRLSASSPAVLILTPAGSPSYSGYEVEIRGGTEEGGPLLWSRGGLQLFDGLYLSLELPAGFLPPGDYGIELFGEAGQERHRLARYPLRLSGDEEGGGELE